MGSNSCLSVLAGWSAWSDLNGQDWTPGSEGSNVNMRRRWQRGSPGVDRIRSRSENLTDFSVAVEEVRMELTLSLL